jgi:polysaccharide biosynthesis transport protein
VLDAVLHTGPAQDRAGILLFISALPRCGNTNTLLNLALTAASQDRRVLVVDANLHAPSVAERLGLPSAPGLREVLAGGNSLEDVIQPTEERNLFALTAGVREASGVRFAAATLRSLLRQLRQRYPLVFVDGPFWDGRPDGSALASACDAVFLVLPEQEAETPRTDALLQLLPGQGIRLAGCILVADACPVR